MQFRFAAFSFLFGFLFVGVSHPQGTVPVYVTHSGDDDLGERVAVSIKDQIRTSGTVRLVYSASDSLIEVNILSMDVDENIDQSRTLYSTNILLTNHNGGFDQYLDSTIGVCGKDKIVSCADKRVQEIVGWADLMLTAAADSAQFDEEESDPLGLVRD